MTIESAIASSELSSSVHPAVLQLGLRYADGSIRGGNARCVAMLTTFRQVIQVCKLTCYPSMPSSPHNLLAQQPRSVVACTVVESLAQNLLSHAS